MSLTVNANSNNKQTPRLNPTIQVEFNANADIGNGINENHSSSPTHAQGGKLGADEHPHSMKETERNLVRSPSNNTHNENEEVNLIVDRDREEKDKKTRLIFIILFMCLEVFIIFIYGFFVTYTDEANVSAAKEKDGDATATVNKYYPFFQDIHVMMLVGFGFLYTYLKRNSWYDLSMNFLIMIWAIQISLLTDNFFHMCIMQKFHKVELDITSFIEADFAAAAVLISFGGVMGKFNTAQLLVLTTIEILFYSPNWTFGTYFLYAQDMGGSMYIHTFGAYFGLACSWVYSYKRSEKLIDHKWNGSNYNSNLFAYIGTVFLWLFWPSFNAALGSGNQRHRIIINTILSLSASCLAVFFLNILISKERKFKMENLLNATLAGGVAIGASCDVISEPWIALLVGFIAGSISIIGFEFLSPCLRKTMNLYDTAGIHNLHGMPGVFGAIVAIILAQVSDEKVLGSSLPLIYSQFEKGRTNSYQARMQASALASSLLFGIGGGLITGAILRCSCFMAPEGINDLFSDIPYFDEVHELLSEEDLEKNEEHAAHANSNAEKFAEQELAKINPKNVL